MNLVPCVRTDDGITLDGQTITLDLGSDLPSRLILGVRPEHFTVSKMPDITVTPDLIENTGAEAYVSFTLATTQITARVPGWMAEDTDNPIGFAIAKQDLCLFDADTGLRVAPQ